MTIFLVAAVVLVTAALSPCAWVCVRGQPEDQIVALGMTGTVQALVLLLLAAGFGESALASLGALLAALSSGGTLVFARFLERWV